MDIGIIEMVLFGIIALCILSVLLVLIIYYRNYFNAKKSWKLEHTAEMNITENMRYTFNNNKLFYIFVILAFLLLLYDTIGTRHISCYIFNGFLLLAYCGMFYMAFIRKKPIYAKVRLYDNGILHRDRHIKWKKFKGYYKKGDYIYLVLNDKILKIGWVLKHNTEVENVIKTHLKEIN